MAKCSDFCLTDDRTWDFSSDEGHSKERAVNNTPVRLCPSLPDQTVNNIWQFLGIMCFLSIPGVLLPNRETKIGSASLVLFRINYSPEHYVVFPTGVSSCKLWTGPAWLPSVLEIKQSVKHCVVCTVSVSGLLSRLGMGEGLLTSLSFFQTYSVIWRLKNVYLYVCYQLRAEHNHGYLL